MDVIASIFFPIFSEPSLLLYVIGGVALGVTVGALPGLTAVTGIALLIPFTFGRDPTQAITLLVALYGGAIYGGSISSILIRTPGTPAAAATALDGFPMSQRGEGGRAIGLATTASCLGGLFGAVVMATLAPLVAKVGLMFGPPEFFALSFFGLGIIVTISGKSLLKGVLAALVGFAVTLIGYDPIAGVPRFTFGSTQLLGGLEFIPILIGLYGVSQVMRGFAETPGLFTPPKGITKFIPPIADLVAGKWVIFKSAVMGVFIGSIPGAGADIAAFTAYGEAKRVSKAPEKFGTGTPDGVLAPEAANNASTGGAMIPMLTLGIPGDAATAVLLGAFTIQGFQPGPVFFSQNLDLVYTIFGAFILAQFAIFIIGISCARFFVRLIRIDRAYFLPVVLTFCLLGAYVTRFSVFDIWVTLGFGIFGYLWERGGFPLAPILLALILGPIFEENLRTSLILSQGDPTIFLTRPISLAFISVAIIVFVSALVARRKTTAAAIQQNNRGFHD